MARFTAGDKVRFYTPDGLLLSGLIVRLNKKTVSVETDDGGGWNVSPILLELVESVGDPPGLFDGAPLA